MIQPGSVLDGRYRVLDLIARGGMADVFAARDVTLDREVAVKAFRVGGADVARFHAETRLLAAFDHRNVVRVFDAGSEDDQPYDAGQEVGPGGGDPDDAPTVFATRTEVLERPVAVPAGRLPRRRPGWLSGLAAVALLLILAVVAFAAQDDGTGQPSGSTTTTPPTSAPPASAPPTTTTAVPSPVPGGGDSGAGTCARLEAAKRALEAGKQTVEQQDRDDKKRREALKKQLESERKQVEAQIQAAGC